MEDVIEAEGTDAEKPGEDNRGKEKADSVCAIVLKGKEADEHKAGDGYHSVCSHGLGGERKKEMKF